MQTFGLQFAVKKQQCILGLFSLFVSATSEFFIFCLVVKHAKLRVIQAAVIELLY